MRRSARPRVAAAAAVIVTIVALVLLAAPARPAGAHALRQSSYPDAGATLAKPPSEVRVTFGEAPDPTLSSLRVLDTAGRDHTSGKTEAVPGQPQSLRVAVGPLAKGVYTVSWRTFSRVDGHIASGAFAFGIEVTPTATAVASGDRGRSPSPTARNVLSRWLLYVGLMLLTGAPVFVLVAVRGRIGSWRRVVAVLSVGIVAAVVGAFGIALDQLHNAGLPTSKLFDSSFGHATIWRVAPVAIAALVLLAGRGRRVALVAGAMAIAAAVAMWGDVEASHAAAASSYRLARMTLQWAHFAAAGVWVGGLVALLATAPAMATHERTAAVRRYSTVALGAVTVVAVTGTLRAYDEVARLDQLVHSTFGRYVLLKSALLVVLVVLAAINRYRSVPAAARSLRPLRAVSRAELALMASVLVAAAMLQGLAPPASASKTRPPAPLVVRGQDFGTTMRVRLTVTPGAAGVNTFRLVATDYDRGTPVDAGAVLLRFALPARPDVGESTLPLPRVALGTYAATAPNLAVGGTWSVTVVVQRADGGVEVPLTVTTRVPRQRIDVQRAAGLPDVYTLDLANGDSLQVYVDPGRAGAHVNTVHVTFFGPDGNEASVAEVTVTATGPGATRAVPLTTRRLDPAGHFVADLLDAAAGSYRVDVDATLATGEPLEGHFALPVR